MKNALVLECLEQLEAVADAASTLQARLDEHFGNAGVSSDWK
jgi:hypothetical protein